MPTPRQQICHFYSQNTRCAATLHWPEQAATPAENTPAILMAHGWGGIQGLLIEDFIHQFVAAGLVVMTFDYIGWGESEGSHRHAINPWNRVATVEYALAFLQQQNGIDKRKILLWGTSFGGGHAIDVAAKHPDLLGVIAHVPMLDGRKAVSAVPLTRMARFSLDIARDLMPFSERYLPIASAAGEYSTMDRDGAERAVEWATTHFGHYENKVAARSMLTMGFYRPIKRLPRLTIPTLLIGATHDSVAPFDQKSIQSKAGPHVQIRTLDANHFDPYLPPYFEQNIQYQLEFIRGLI